MVKSEIGHWSKDSAGLPCFSYTGEIPYRESLPTGKPVKLPQDPWFLLGNDQLTLFTHVSGEYELITGQRAWGRVNQGNGVNTGANRAILERQQKDGGWKQLPLTGMNAVEDMQSSRVFGCGFAHYTHRLNGVTVTRNLSVKPNAVPGEGTSAFLLTATLHNNTPDAVTLRYTEAVTARYVEIQYQHTPDALRKVRYETSVFEDPGQNVQGFRFRPVSDDPLLSTDSKSMSRYEVAPPSLYMQALSPGVLLAHQQNEVSASFEATVGSGDTAVIRMIIGYTFHEGPTSVNRILKELQPGQAAGCVSAFADSWEKLLPAFPQERDEELRQELRWHAHALEAMATYSAYYEETKIPQGTIYDYHFGAHASARDNYQHALPLIYYRPELARSVLRYMLKRTTPLGDIRLLEVGYGYAHHDRYSTSDQQLFFFLLLSEYLRVTGDAGFLSERVAPFPGTGQTPMTVLDFVEKCFLFLRDDIGTGKHGIVRLLNSDWNDAVFYIVNAPYNGVLFTGESHMNSAMAVSTLQSLIPQLRKCTGGQEAQALRLCKSMEIYRGVILDAFLADWGDRPFPRRMYFNGKAYGEENMFLEPQGYALQINELTDAKRRGLYREMRKRLYAGEKLGARQQQTPEFESAEFDQGSRENGGFWWSLNGPVIMGVSRFDSKEAERLLRAMTLRNYAEAFPQYWSSYWSAADNQESSLIDAEGLPDQSEQYASIPVYCAHPHAWILYCYYYIQDQSI